MEWWEGASEVEAASWHARAIAIRTTVWGIGGSSRGQLPNISVEVLLQKSILIV